MTRRVGIVGTFDVANYGDLLFPLLAEHELGKRLGELELVRYSHSDPGPGWPFRVTPLDELPAALPSLDLLLVGGGHLVRFDKEVAPGYAARSEAVHNPTGYWLGPSLAAAAAGVPVAWNAIGVSPDLPAWGLPLLRAALESIDYVAVRESDGADELRRVAPGIDIQVVPDTAFCLDALPREHAREQAAALLSGAEVEGPYVVIQASAHLAPARAELERLAAVALDSGRAVLELPIGPALGDAPGALGIDDGLVRFGEWPDPLVLTELVARADAVVGISLHLSIAAVVAGVPVFRPDAAHRKYALLDGLPGVQRLEDAGAAVALPSHVEPGEALRARQAAVQRHWDAVAELVGAHRPWRAAASRTFLAAAAAYEREAEAEAEAAASLEDREALHTALQAARAEHATTVGELRALERASAELAVRRQAEETRLRERLHALGQVLDETHRAFDEVLARDQRRLRPRLRRSALRVGQRLWWRLPRRARDELRLRVFGDEAATAHAGLRGSRGQTVPRVAPRRSPVRSTASVIIPTLDGGPLFERVLASVAAQRGVRDVELIVADSGSTDGTVERAEAAGARILEIPSGEFGHGRTRNVAAEEASGDVLLMLVQDAVLVGPHVLRNLLLELEADERCFAACARQIPRSDADLFGAFVVTAHERVMRAANAAARDRPPAELSPVERRALGSLDDVCGALRRSVWDELRFADVEFAEDLELGLRAVRRGWHVSLPDDAAVAHSHTRGADYHFRRGVADRLYVAPLVGDTRLSETSGTSFERLAAALRALLGETAGVLVSLGSETRPLSLWLATLAAALPARAHGAALGGELAEVAALLPPTDERDLDPAVLAAARTELVHFLEWRELARFAEAHPAVDVRSAAGFVARLAAAQAGQLVGDHLRREERRDVERVLLAGV
jgi:GT2 family glycosyltransferase